MSVDFHAVAAAIATRFAAAAITPPTNESDIAQSTADLPSAITDEPIVLVFPPEVRLSFGPSVRKGLLEFPVRFYLYKVRNNERNSELVLKWLTSLYAQLPDTLAHLGLSTYVNSAVIRNLTPGMLVYAGTEYHGIELTVEVLVSEGLTVTG